MLNSPPNFIKNNNIMFPNNNLNPFINPNLFNQNVNNFNNVNFNNQNIPNLNANNQNVNQFNENQNINQINSNEQKASNDLRKQIQKTNSEMKLDNFRIDINQIGLINSIINFYHISGNEYLNINEKYQIMNIINRLNPDISSLKENEKILDPLYYIKEPKKLIKFINSDFNLFNVKIPISINKTDLYSIVDQYKYLNNTNILLIHNNSIIEKDETSIKFLSEGDMVIIIENRNYKDDSFYNSLIKNNNGADLINIRLIDDYRENPTYILQFPSNISYSQMMKAINLKFGYCKNDNIYVNHIFTDGKKSLKEIFIYLMNDIHYYKKGRVVAFHMNIYGKYLQIKVSNKLKTEYITTICLGLLNSNKLLVTRIEAETGRKVKNIFFNNNKLNIKDEMSIYSMGITQNCSCLAEFQ